MDIVAVEADFAKTVLDARRSVDFFALGGVGILRAYQDPGILDLKLPSTGLQRRCILATPSHWSKFQGYETTKKFERVCQEISELGWGLAVADIVPNCMYVIVDGKVALLAVTSKEQAGKLPQNPFNKGMYFTPEAAIFKDHFERFWNGGLDPGLIYENFLCSSIPGFSSELITASSDCWDGLISHLSQSPDRLRELSPRRFEEVVAELLVRKGMEVELTSASRDGGRDIVAWADTWVGKHLYLVECKRYAENNAVGVEIVRSLYGVIEAERATSGVVVTTSSFTRGARQFQDALGHRLYLKDYSNLRRWLTEARESS